MSRNIQKPKPTIIQDPFTPNFEDEKRFSINRCCPKVRVVTKCDNKVINQGKGLNPTNIQVSNRPFIIQSDSETNIFEVTNGNGTIPYFSVDSTGVSITGDLRVDGIIDPPAVIFNILEEQPIMPTYSQGVVWADELGLNYTNQNNVTTPIVQSLPELLKTGNTTEGEHLFLTNGSVLTSDADLHLTVQDESNIMLNGSTVVNGELYVSQNPNVTPLTYFEESESFSIVPTGSHTPKPLGAYEVQYKFTRIGNLVTLSVKQIDVEPLDNMNQHIMIPQGPSTIPERFVPQTAQSLLIPVYVGQTRKIGVVNVLPNVGIKIFINFVDLQPWPTMHTTINGFSMSWNVL